MPSVIKVFDKNFNMNFFYLYKLLKLKKKVSKF